MVYGSFYRKVSILHTQAFVGISRRFVQFKCWGIRSAIGFLFPATVLISRGRRSMYAIQSRTATHGWVAFRNRDGNQRRLCKGREAHLSGLTRSVAAPCGTYAEQSIATSYANRTCFRRFMP